MKAYFDVLVMWHRLMRTVIDGLRMVTSFVYLGDEQEMGGGCMSAVTKWEFVGWNGQ